MNTRNVFFSLFTAAFILLFCSILFTHAPGAPGAPMVAASAGAALWTGRTFEVVLQGFIILAGVVSILLLLSSGRRKERSE